MATDTLTEKVVVTSSQLEGRTLTLSSGEASPWQRCQVSDRVFVVVSGAGYLFLSHGRDEERQDLSPGDAAHIRRMTWHRFLAAADQSLSGTIVTFMPADPEYRR
jgi:quercetin dioxygenase-like cupin family protein